jgi:hypothetical protein
VIHSYLFRFCFLCRLDEDVSDGLHPLDATLPTDQIEYIKALNNHVRNGTRKKAKAFISATWDIRSALAWSYYGIYKIVKVFCLSSCLCCVV